MRALIIANERAEHQRSFGGAFAAGLKRHGWAVTVSDGAPRRHAFDMTVTWGVRQARRLRGQCGEICVLERGYIGDRFQWTSVSFGGGLNGRGVFRGPFEDASRWNKHFSDLMKPWRDNSGPPLLLQQIPGDSAIQGVDINAFYLSARARWPSAVVRGHPGERGRPPPARSLHEELNTASHAITWNSNSAVDAVLYGVPAIAMDCGSMAWPVTGHELELPPRPDRQAWAHALAWKQWTREEMETGYCWDNIRG
jgi:hypothetical protein